MRIIGGRFKGKPLKDMNFDHIRPTADKVKQALFTKFQFDIEGARVVDLFCGTGGLGIEAISRGAKEVIFVDKNPKSVMVTKENLKSIGSDAKVFCIDFKIALQKLEGKFDFILVDPPYKSGVYEDVIGIIAERDLLADGGVIVCEHSKEDRFDWDPFDVFDEKNYGTITLSFLRKKQI